MTAKLQAIIEDITLLNVDAIVNAANTTLLGGGGVDGAIHRAAAGPKLLEACQQLGGCPLGKRKSPKVLNCQPNFVIHTVGPVWRGGAKGEPKLLASCYQSSLRLAEERQIKTLAFSAISCGIYGYPISQAATIAVKETANFLELRGVIETVYFVCFEEDVFRAYQQALDSLNHHE